MGNLFEPKCQKGRKVNLDYIAPIVLFAYRRPEHTRRTLEALAANEMASESELFVFIDGPRGEDDKGNVAEVRHLAQMTKGFARVEVIQRSRNYGLAQNIIEGVTEIVNYYGRVIVLEDDIMTSPFFLKFMNEALHRYAGEPKIWHVSGWNYPIDPEGLPEAFCWRVMNCWGWATWRDRWSRFQKDPERLMRAWSRKEINRFNLDGAYNFWAQVLRNHKGRLNTWAVFWYATIFENGGLCLNPTRSLVSNIGHDGTGQHCRNESPYGKESLTLDPPLNFPNVLEECQEATRRIKKLLKQQKKPLFYRIWRRLKWALLNY